MTNSPLGLLLRRVLPRLSRGGIGPERLFVWRSGFTAEAWYLSRYAATNPAGRGARSGHASIMVRQGWALLRL